MNKKKIILISDYTLQDGFGGCEINDYILQKELSKYHELKIIKSMFVKQEHLNKDAFYIVSNFFMLSEYIKNILIEKCNYIIYEHDHKYCVNRNPGIYKNFIIPQEQIINKNFYENAKFVLCQSEFQKNIIEKNLNLKNLINLSGNLWEDEVLDKLLLFSRKEKKEITSIVANNINHKNTIDAIKYCELKNKKYELIYDNDNLEFLNKLSNNKELLFLPQTPETFSRICVEARMCNVVVITNNLVGATKEEWFYKKGEELISFIKIRKQNIISIILDILEDQYDININTRVQYK